MIPYMVPFSCDAGDRVKESLAPLPAGPEERKNCAFEDLEALLLAVGFIERRTSGSHVFFKKSSLAISVPRRKPVKENYVEQVLQLVELSIA